VQAVAATWGGGGHRKAAGATVRLALGDAERAVVAEVQRALGTAEATRP